MGKTATVLVSLSLLAFALPATASAADAPEECYEVDSSTGTGLTWFVDDAVHSGCDRVANWSENPKNGTEYVEEKTGVPTPDGEACVDVMNFARCYKI